jgi:hypothetical protein
VENISNKSFFPSQSHFRSLFCFSCSCHIPYFFNHFVLYSLFPIIIIYKDWAFWPVPNPGLVELAPLSLQLSVSLPLSLHDYKNHAKWTDFTHIRYLSSSVIGRCLVNMNILTSKIGAIYPAPFQKKIDFLKNWYYDFD